MATKGGDEDSQSLKSEPKQEENTKQEQREQPKQTTEKTNQDYEDQEEEDAGKFNTDHLLQEVSEKLLQHSSNGSLNEPHDSGIINNTITQNETIDESNLETEHTKTEDQEDVENKTSVVDNESQSEANGHSSNVQVESVQQQEREDVEVKPESTEVTTNVQHSAELELRSDAENKIESQKRSESDDSKVIEETEKLDTDNKSESAIHPQSVHSETVIPSDQSQPDVQETVKQSTSNDLETVEQKDNLAKESNETAADVDVVPQAESVGKEVHSEKTEVVTTDESVNLPTNSEGESGSNNQVENITIQEPVGVSETDSSQNKESSSNNENKSSIPQIQEDMEDQQESKGMEQQTFENKPDDVMTDNVNNDGNENASNKNELSEKSERSYQPNSDEEINKVRQEEKYESDDEEDMVFKRQTVETDQSEGTKQHTEDAKTAAEPEQKSSEAADDVDVNEENNDSPKIDTDEDRRDDIHDTDNTYEAENQSDIKYKDEHSEVNNEDGEHKEIPDETYENDYEQMSQRSVSSMSSKSSKDDKTASDEKSKPAQQNQTQQSRKSVRMDEKVQTKINQPATSSTKPKGNASSSQSPAQKHATRKTSRSAQPFSRPVHKPEERPAKAVSFTSLRRPKTSNYGSMISRDGNKRRDFFQEELRRLRVRLGKEAENIKKPQAKEHVPFVWTSLEPYYNTYVANYLINLQGDEFHQGYTTRSTAIGLCDPWIDLRMDKNILPKLEQPKGQNKDKPKTQKKRKDTAQKEGSTRLPKFPVVDFNAGKENATRKFPYNEVAKFRTELKDRFSSNAKKKIDKDYKRTKDDFYRMDLHKLDEIHPLNRPHMRKTYFAYLQNTPGSRKAVKDCVKTLDDEESGQRSQSKLEENQHQQAVATN